jgi:hypothetical protein
VERTGKIRCLFRRRSGKEKKTCAEILKMALLNLIAIMHMNNGIFIGRTNIFFFRF